MDIFGYVYEYFFSSYLGMLKLLASFFILLSVYQLSKQNIWNFLWGGFGVAIYGYIFMEVQLYADMVLQWAYFVPVSFFGWWWWYTKGPEKNALPLSVGTDVQWLKGIILLGVAWGVTAYVFDKYTEASYPWPDSFILVSSVYAQYLLSKKIVESWLLWIAVDIVAIPLYAAKGLYVSSGLYVILLVLASYGAWKWSREWLNKEMSLTFGR